MLCGMLHLVPGSAPTQLASWTTAHQIGLELCLVFVSAHNAKYLQFGVVLLQESLAPFHRKVSML